MFRHSYGQLKQIFDRLLRLSVHEGTAVAPSPRFISFGDLHQLTPISPNFGLDRGRPVDRYYIENFLAEHAGDIRGRVLEIGDNSYTYQFGAAKVTRSDVLHITDDNPKATLVGDLTTANHIPSAIFDSIILTQTLQYIYDVRAGLATLYRIMKPGGVLLATLPGISQIDRDWGGQFWSFTTRSAQRLFEDQFSEGKVAVKAYGNVFAAVAFLHGLTVEELRREDLDYQDPYYPVSIAVRAAKPDTL